MAKALISSNCFSIGSSNKNNNQQVAVVPFDSQDIVFSILDKLDPIDLLRLTAVSKEWLALSKEYNLTTQRWSITQLAPMLLILKEGKLSLYSVSARKLYDNINLSVPPDKQFCGSGHGWLATVDPAVDAVLIQLWNPFDKAAISSPLCLPPLQHYGALLRKVTMLLDPSLHGDPNNYIVAAVTDYQLALFRPGQKYWTCIRELRNCTDLVLYKGRIYGAENSGKLWSLELVNHAARRIDNLDVIEFFFSMLAVYRRVHLVESSSTGDLLLIQRSCILDTPYPYEPYRFRIYKLVIDDDGNLVQQDEIKSIGDEAIFLSGGNQSVSVSVCASKFPGCQPNSIYCSTNDFGDNPKTIYVCNLQDGTVRQLDPLGGKLVRLALWILPRFNGLSQSHFPIF